jgi:hypothetical protein
METLCGGDALSSPLFAQRRRYDACAVRHAKHGFRSPGSKSKFAACERVALHVKYMPECFDLSLHMPFIRAAGSEVTNVSMVRRFAGALSACPRQEDESQSPSNVRLQQRAIKHDFAGHRGDASASLSVIIGYRSFGRVERIRAT